MYSHTFPTLSERFFKGGAWPRAEVVAPLVDHDHVFCMLYRELYFRHIYATGRPTLEQRRESWDNYRELFGVVLNSNLNMQLPNGWLWDMVDEFVYQFQSYLQHRGKLAGKGPEEVQALRAAEGTWDAAAVVAFLSELAARSRIREELAAPGGAEALYASEGYSPAASNVLRMLGYFSLIGLARVHCVLGDHAAALRALAPLNPFDRRGLFATKIAMAAITMFYYSGFAYLAAQRWLDAARCFNFVLAYVARVKTHHARGPGYDQILKKNEQMHALLAVAVALCPAAARALDEAVATSLRDKYGEKMRAMASGSEATYEELFAYACPKFASAAPPDWADPGANTNAAAYRAQLAAFMAVVQERRHLPAIKQFLNLYSVSHTPKIGGARARGAVARAADAAAGSWPACLPRRLRRGASLIHPPNAPSSPHLLPPCRLAEHPRGQAGLHGGDGARHGARPAGPAHPHRHRGHLGGRRRAGGRAPALRRPGLHRRHRGRRPGDGGGARGARGGGQGRLPGAPHPEVRGDRARPRLGGGGAARGRGARARAPRRGRALSRRRGARRPPTAGRRPPHTLLSRCCFFRCLKTSTAVPLGRQPLQRRRRAAGKHPAAAALVAANHLQLLPRFRRPLWCWIC
jgi:translation initiation factor 3 subunit L